MKILVTRPEPLGTHTAARLAEMGHEPIVAPCLTIVQRPAMLPDDPAAIIITSSQAVPQLPLRFANLPAFCVGDMTTERLRAAGFTNVTSAGGDAGDLLRLVVARAVPGLHLMAVGADQGFELAVRLNAAGVRVQRCVVYVAEPASALPPAALAALMNKIVDGAVFFSADTGRAFSRLRPPATEYVTAYALSERVAVALASLPWRAIRVALAPNEAELLALLHE